MISVSVIGKGSAAAAVRLSEMLRASAAGKTFVITAAASGKETDILLVSGTLPEGEKKRIKCGILVAPNNMDVSFASCDRRVTCGMSEDDDITMSSVGETECVIALRRELKTVGGTITERQEVRMRKGGGLSPEALLAVFGCALMLDVPPDKMG